MRLPIMSSGQVADDQLLVPVAPLPSRRSAPRSLAVSAHPSGRDDVCDLGWCPSPSIMSAGPGIHERRSDAVAACRPEAAAAPQER